MSAEPVPKTRTKANSKIGVTLLRTGIGRERFDLPEGATLGDLLRLAQAEADHLEILIDGRPLAECLVLQPDTIVSVTPKPTGTAPRGDWRRNAGMFKDNPAFEEMMAEIEARRRAGKKKA
jgi:hypothetical protein